MSTPEHRLREQLHALAEPPLPQALWSRLHDRHRRQIRRRRQALVASVGIVSVLLMSPLLLPDGPRHAPVASMPLAATPALIVEPEARLRLLDAAIQNAYDEGASDDEIQPLWEARKRLISQQPALPHKPPSTHS